jgi:hypothetical protein
MMEKFLMCFINGKRQVIELKRRGQEKRARRMATRPEPTIIGNCEGWNFIVGKMPASMSPEPHMGSALLQCNKHFTHSLFTTGIRATWTTCGLAVDQLCMNHAPFHNMTAAFAVMSICVERRDAFYPK